MIDFQVLTAVRGCLLNENASPHVHLALPPKAIYPLILVELEEIWSPYLSKLHNKRKSILARMKFKVSIYSRSPGLEEAANLSQKARTILEGTTLRMPGGMAADMTTTIRFLACVTETSAKFSAGESLRMIHHFYDCIVRA
jgi:hypothetical protein